MHLDESGVRADGFDANPHQALALQVLEVPVEHAGLGPAAHARVDGVPGAVVRGQRAPLAAVGRDEADGIDHVEVVQAHVAALAGQQWGDLLELRAGELHRAILPRHALIEKLVLSRPNASLAKIGFRLMQDIASILSSGRNRLTSGIHQLSKYRRRTNECPRLLPKSLQDSVLIPAPSMLAAHHSLWLSKVGIPSQQLSGAIFVTAAVCVLLLRRVIFRAVVWVVKMVFCLVLLIVIVGGVILAYQYFGAMIGTGAIALAVAFIVLAGRSSPRPGKGTAYNDNYWAEQQDVGRLQREHHYRENERIRHVHEDSRRRNPW